MKMSISWHEECLKNIKSSLGRKKQELASLQAEVDRYEQNVFIYSWQIKEAKRKGKDGFDQDKFGKKILAKLPNK